MMGSLSFSIIEFFFEVSSVSLYSAKEFSGYNGIL